MILVHCWIQHPVYALDQTYTYTHDSMIDCGIRVHVPFGHQQVIGFVDHCTIKDEHDQRDYKPISALIDEESVLSEELMELGKWMSKMTISPTISCFGAMLPSKMKPTSTSKPAVKEKWVRVLDNNGKLSLKQASLYQQISEKKEMLYKEAIAYSSSAVKGLLQKGFIELVEKDKSAILYNHEKKKSSVQCTDEQLLAIDNIKNCEQQTVLLHGVTGSGKTEVYLQLMMDCIEQGKQGLICVPEISLTPQMVQRVLDRFGSEVAIYHSGLNEQEKYEQYKLLKHGKVKLVVGTRSAIFMPFSKLGLIILDEEHDQSYKQDKTPSYHCRDVAIYRGQQHGCKVILGSATPSFESYARALKKVYGLVELKSRINETLPVVHCINSYDYLKKGESVILTPPVKNALEKCFNERHQAIILLNRRGYNTVMRCHHCQEILMCRDCDLALSYHQSDRRCHCHTCGFSMAMPRVCPSCHHQEGFLASGFGTQRVEEELQQLFPMISIARMDRDTTTKKNAHQTILEAFGKGKYHCLVGTQMIAKGLDFDNVTCVVVINADAGLSRSDYRSAEITFSLLVQASGRSGRSQHHGEVYLQVANEHHYAIECARQQDYKTFFHKEMEFRHQGGYPPYYYFISIITNDDVDDIAKDGALALFYQCNNHCVCLGPSNLGKIANKYRYRIILKDKNLQKLISIVENSVEWMKKNKPRSRYTIDVNPLVLE